jgi:hypothetical protein
MQRFIAVATVAWCMLLCSAQLVVRMSASAAGIEANHPPFRSTFPELNVASPNLTRAGENTPPMNDSELLATRLQAVGVHDADTMGTALGSHDSNKGSFIPRAPIFHDLACGLESCWLGSRTDSTLRKSFEPTI